MKKMRKYLKLTVPSLLVACGFSLKLSAKEFLTESSPYSLAEFSKNGRYAVTLKDARIQLWNAPTCEFLQESAVSGEGVRTLRFSPDSSYIILSVTKDDKDDEVRVYKLHELFPEHQWTEPDIDLSEEYGSGFSDDDVGLFEAIEGGYDNFILSYIRKFDTRKKMLTFFKEEKKQGVNALKYAIHCGCPRVVEIIGNRAVTFRIISKRKLTKYLYEAKAREKQLLN